jgi:hypothetical protein
MDIKINAAVCDLVKNETYYPYGKYGIGNYLSTPRCNMSPKNLLYKVSVCFAIKVFVLVALFRKK